MSSAATLLTEARERDAADPLRHFRDEFHLPGASLERPEIYLVGNSLGLQPRRTARFVEEELAHWRDLGVRGHFEGTHPWLPYHEFLTPTMAELVGGMPDEVVMMNSLTVNLHLMLATFFRPAGKRRKILMEAQAFPSDYQAAASQLKWHGIDPREGLCQLTADEGSCLTTERIVEAIEEQADSLALVLMPGVQYYTGQAFDLKTITEVAHRYGIPVGADLAHAAGNLPLALHDWDVDFAVWCSYKYLNSGPGSVGGCFVHRRHHQNRELPRLAGWWGHNKQTRFQMKNEFDPIPTVEGWQLSNPPILSLAAIRASLEVFAEAGGMGPLRQKSVALTGFLEQCLTERLPDTIRILTPTDPQRRGCQLSLAVIGEPETGKAVYEKLEAAGIRTDWREPNGIRCAPVPLYNTFEEAWRFVDELAQCLES